MDSPVVVAISGVVVGWLARDWTFSQQTGLQLSLQLQPCSAFGGGAFDWTLGLACNLRGWGNPGVFKYCTGFEG